MKNKKLLILNGPGLADLNVGGGRCGNITLNQIRDECAALCDHLGISLDFRQTDDEEEILRWIVEDSENYGALIINPVGCARAETVDLDRYHSAIQMIAHLHRPVIEVHLTNIFREGDELAKPLQGLEGEMGFVCGMGIHSYLLGINAAAKRLQS